MNLEEITTKIQKLAEKHAGKFGDKANFDFGDEGVFLDDTVTPPVVSNELSEDASFTLQASVENLQKIMSGDMNVMMAFMSGKLKIKGSKAAAMKLAALF